ncbi:MAG TPA: permease-like cell division protein FtsX, partial [bacterium]|nr:permease-like cell division protein FtsX [bacterium]
MNFISRLGYVIKEGILQVIRAKGLSVAVVVIVAATLLQLSLFLGVSRVLDHLFASTNQKFEMAVFLSTSTTQADTARIQDFLSHDPRVDSAQLVSKEAALADFRKDAAIDQMVKVLGENPLTDSFTVVLKNEAVDQADALAAELKKDSSVDDVSYGKGEWETLSNLIRVIRWAGLLMAGLVFLTALFIVANTLTLALWARREDMLSMARLGAPGWMRWGPYLCEGVFQGFLGSVMVTLVLEVIRRAAGEALQKYGGF